MRKARSIFTIIALPTIVIILVFVILTCVLQILYFSRSMMQMTTDSAEEILTQMNNNVDYYISEIIDIAGYVRNLSREATRQSKEEITERMLTLIATRSDIIRIALFDLDGNVILTTDDGVEPGQEWTLSHQWFQRAKNGEGDFFFSGPYMQHLSSGQVSPVISYSQRINYRDSATPEGVQAVLLIDLNFNAISTLADNVQLSKSGYIYFLSNDNEMIYHPKQDEIDNGTFKEDLESVEEHVFGTYVAEYRGEKRLTVIKSVYQTRWRIIGVAYVDELLEPLYTFRAYIIFFALVVIIFAVVLILLTTKRITSPLRKLEQTMRTIETGNFAVAIPDGKSREVQSLASSFRIMVSRISDLMDKIKETEAVKRQRELDALQAKINPHFLYNTLDSVVWMAESGDKEGVIHMVTSLASLFRISIAKGKDIITLREELGHVRSYLEIQAMRYKDKFVWAIELPEELQDCPTIKLIVQPIVENSIYHGIKYLLDEGEIRICVTAEGEKLHITVSDNGAGMHPDTLKSLLDHKASHEHMSDGNGIGLLNIDERIKLCYGEEYGLSIESELEVGTTVVITIPKLPPIKPVVNLKN